MPDDEKKRSSTSEMRQRALSRWDNEGGAGRDGPKESHAHVLPDPGIPNLNDAEQIQLRIRVIALENLMIMLLADGSDKQLALAREMATYISPRAGFTHHPLTLQAAAHMDDLVERAIHYRSARRHASAHRTALRSAGSTSASNHGFFAAQCRERHDGCGSGKMVGR